MRKIAGFVLLMLLAAAGFAQPTSPESSLNLIPEPAQSVRLNGEFKLKPDQGIFASGQLRKAAALLAELWECPENVVTKAAKATIRFNLDDRLGDEAYRLRVHPDGIEIDASTARGAMRGVFTLQQLRLLQPDMNRIPCAEITDSPRFAYRGMHLDVSRNFYPISFIKKYIDLMALYKYNTFHWHLTDGAGWRLEIKRYPELTSQAAFRTHKTWTEWRDNGARLSHEGDPNAYGGYYTQDEAREIVAYAARRGITVIPEIEMPGHSEEVLAVYPQLSCTGQPYTSGEFCIGNPETFQFFENVLDEVLEIFPSKYIHIGGDEASTAHWEKCEKCQELKRRNNLGSEHEIQAYLIKHMERYLKSHGRRLMGWDEIIEGGLPADATVMSWRGMEPGLQAAKAGHDVIMVPGETYFDSYQTDPTTQPQAIGGFLPLQRVYAFDPVPDTAGEAAAHIMGTQANLWTEYMPNTDHVEYMAYPRAIALAEVAWTDRAKRAFDDFHRRLQNHFLLLQRMQVNYYRPSTYITVTALPEPAKQQMKIDFETEQYHPEIHYTTDGTEPNWQSARYEAPFYTSGKTVVKAAIFKNGIPIGKTTEHTANYHKAIGKPVQFNTRWDNSYPAQGESTLTNGIEGSLTYGDKQWLGYLRDFDVTVDLGSLQDVHSVSVRFMHQPGPGVFLPQFVEVQLSADGVHFEPAGKAGHSFDRNDHRLAFNNFMFRIDGGQTRYIRLIAPNTERGYLFVDEIIVY